MDFPLRTFDNPVAACGLNSASLYSLVCNLGACVSVVEVDSCDNYCCDEWQTGFDCSGGVCASGGGGGTACETAGNTCQTEAACVTYCVGQGYNYSWCSFANPEGCTLPQGCCECRCSSTNDNSPGVCSVNCPTDPDCGGGGCNNDGTVDIGENCDCGAGANDCSGACCDSKDCTDFGCTGGTLACSACSFDTSSCTGCGAPPPPTCNINGVLEGTEECEDGSATLTCPNAGETCVNCICQSGGGSSTIWPVTFTNPLDVESFEELIASVINWLLAIVGSIVLLFIIIAGIMYMTAAGDEAQLTRAKKMLFYTILGFAIILISYSLIKEIKDILGIVS